MVPILYSFRRCPYAMRARMALLISEMPFELREVKLAAKPPEMLAVSPKATVPVLVLPDGTVIDESLDIMCWALGRRDPEQWLDGDAGALIASNDGTFKYHLDGYKYPDRHGGDPIGHRTIALGMLRTLEDRLSGQPYLCGRTRSLADIALMPFVRQFAAVDRAWFAEQSLPAVRQWLETLIASPLFERAMVRIAPWQAPPASQEGPLLRIPVDL